jgi:hypothetical protein
MISMIAGYQQRQLTVITLYVQKKSIPSWKQDIQKISKFHKYQLSVGSLKQLIYDLK